MPVIRNNLIMLLSDKTYEELNSREGKEAARQEVLDGHSRRAR
jgi:flagellar protein FliL